MMLRKNVPRSMLVTGLFLSLALGSTTVIAAGNILVPNDTNSRITVENAVVKGDETTLFFLTWPDRGDPERR